MIFHIKGMSRLRHLNFRTLLYVLIVGATIARVAAAVQYDPTQVLVTDPGRHWGHATDVLGVDPLKGIDPIGYQIWLSVIAKLTLGDPLAIGIYAALLSALTPWIWYRFAREVFPNKHHALVCYALIAWLPSWIGIYSYFMAETLILPLFGSAMWACWRALRKHDPSSMLLAVVLSTATLLTRLSPLPALAIALGVVISVQKRRMRSAVICILVAALLTIPSGYRSYKIIHIWAPFGYPAMNTIYYRSGCSILTLKIVSDQGTSFYGFASPQIGKEPLAPLSHWHTSRQPTVHVNIDLRNGTKDWDEAIRATSMGPEHWTDLWGENAMFMLAGESWPDNNPERLWDGMQISSRWIWVLLLPLLAIVNCYLAFRRRIIGLLSVIVFVSIIGLVLQTTAYIEGRYRKPFEGLVLIDAVWAALELRKLYRSGEPGPLLPTSL